MKLYLISQDHNGGYDTYDSAVVAADNETDAMFTYPADWDTIVWNDKENCWYSIYKNGGSRKLKAHEWVEDPRKYVTVKEIGTASKGIEKGVVTASFNAG